MTDLFQSDPTLSPRLAWLQLHRVHTARDFLPRSSGPYNEKPWRCSNSAHTINVWGDSEDEVIWGWCREHGVAHYDAAGWVMRRSDEHPRGNGHGAVMVPGTIGGDLLPGMTVATSEICDE